MTNISAFKVYEGEKKDSQNVVLVADSMASDRRSGQKNDLVPKLFVMNGALLMPSGDSSAAAYHVCRELMKSQVKGPEAISKSVLDIASREKIPSRIALDFIVSGYENGKARLFFVNATGFDLYNPNGSPDSKGFMSENEVYAFSGSGMPFADRIIRGKEDLGLDPRPRDITAGISLMKTIADAATESTGVNDKLQYGVVTPNGMHVLFHPNVHQLDFHGYNDYVKRLLGLELAEQGERGTEQNLRAIRANKPAWTICRDFYNAFDLDLDEFEAATRDFRVMSDMFRDGSVQFDRVQGAKVAYHEAKKIADKAVFALLSGSSKQIVAYLKDERERREQFYEQVGTKK